jgi:hypothetical protein
MFAVSVADSSFVACDDMPVSLRMSVTNPLYIKLLLLVVVSQLSPGRTKENHDSSQM